MLHDAAADARAALASRRAALVVQPFATDRNQARATLDCVLAELNTVETEWAAGRSAAQLGEEQLILRAAEAAFQHEREQVLRAELDDALRAAHTEGQRAEGLEAALLEADGVREAEAAAWRQRIADAEAAALLESDRQGRAAQQAGEALRDTRRALACGAHAALLLRVSSRGVRALRLESVLRHWRLSAALLAGGTRAAEAAALLSASQGKLATLRERQQRAEEAAAHDARAASEEHARQLARVHKKLEAERDRRAAVAAELREGE